MTPSLRRSLAVASIAVGLVVAAVFCMPVSGAPDAANQACSMCKNINMGKPLKYACPSNLVKDCSINMNGWCCKEAKVHSRCLSCVNGKAVEEEEDDDEEDI